jgi:hypothetical protein
LLFTWLGGEHEIDDPDRVPHPQGQPALHGVLHILFKTFETDMLRKNYHNDTVYSVFTTPYTVKKVRDFPVPNRKFHESLASDIPAGDRKSLNFFYSVVIQ